MYLNVIPPPSLGPLPSVRGLGQARVVSSGRRRGMGQVRHILIPHRGLGQLPAGSYSSCAAYLAANLAALPSESEAAMLLNTPSPSGSVLSALFINLPSTPEQTAQAIVQQLAAEYCGWSTDQVAFGGTLAPDCGDGGTAAAAAAYPDWLAYYNSLPASVWSSGTVSAAVANPQIVQPAAGGSQSGSQGASSTPGQTNNGLPSPSVSAFPATAANLANLTAPGQPFIAGDMFQLTLTGAPNAVVVETASSQNGQSMGSYQAGSTDASRTLVITGTFTAADVGSWQETWSVGGAPSATINFSVGAAPSSGGSQSGSQGSQSGSNTGSGTAGGQVTQSGNIALPSWLTSDIAGIPVWGLIAAGMGVILLMPKK